MNNLVFQLCLCAVAGWVNRGQQQMIEYLLEENRVLREQLGGRRLRLTDAQRRRLAVRAKALGRKTLLAAVCIVTPDTRSALVQEFRGQEVRRKPPPRPRPSAYAGGAGETCDPDGVLQPDLGIHQNPWRSAQPWS